jgi:hypothetical protein
MSDGNFRCTCGRTFTTEGGLKHHLTATGKNGGTGHAAATELVGTRKVRADAEGQAVVDVKVLVRVNGKELSLAQFTSLANRLAAVRDTLRHLGLD